jgi:uncharacterized protein YbjT (DUF2867 family)
MTKVLVFGATGDQGHPLLRRLLAHGHEVVAASRQGDGFNWSVFPGVTPAPADFNDVASLTKAATGCEAIVMHLPFTFDRSFAQTMGASCSTPVA